MKSSSNLVIEGIVLADPGAGPVGGVIVSARSDKSNRPAGRSTTDALGRFTLTLAVGSGMNSG